MDYEIAVMWTKYLLISEWIWMFTAMFLLGCSNSTQTEANLNKKELHLSVIPMQRQKLLVKGDWMMEELPEDDYKARIEPQISYLVLPKNTVGHVPIRVTNLGQSRWSSLGAKGDWGKFAIVLSYHVIDQSNIVIVKDGERFPLPDNLLPGESVVIDATIPPIHNMGTYWFVFDMVQENVSWFEEKGSVSARLLVSVG